ncbi:MAG: serine hydrolase domain-containing protein [Myxococcota bacterium]|nr:serine hydrolase domain-containing protein [Myxococcota bacterium]
MQLWFLFGYACNTAEEKNDSNDAVEVGSTIQIQWEGEDIDSAEAMSMPDNRRFIEENVGILRVRNTGATSQPITEISLPDFVSLTVDFPLLIEPDEQMEFAFRWDSHVAEGSHQGLIRLQNDDALLWEGALHGLVTPYIQLHLQSMPNVDSQIESEMESQDIVGAAVAVVEGQDIVYLRGFGYADLAQETPVDPSVHRFRWASLAKGLTGVLAMQLQEASVLDIDDSVEMLYENYQVPSTYLPNGWTDLDDALEIPEADRMITLRQLLSHTGCVQHYSNGAVWPEPEQEDRNDPNVNTGMAWAITFWEEAPLLCIPGSAYHYSTPGFNLAGVALESASGSSYEQLLKEGINDIIGAQTLLPDYHWDPAPNRVTGYNWVDGAPSPDTDSDVSWKLAAGGVNSTAEDLARFCAGLLGDVLLDPTMRDSELWTVQPQADEYGLGFFVSGAVVGHSGSQQSAKTAILIDPSQDRCVVAMSNSTWVDPFGLVYAAW